MQLDPLKLFERLWEMRRWGRVMIVITGIAGFFFFVSFYTDFFSTLWLGVAFGLLLVILFVCSFEVTRKTKQDLAQLVFDGEQIKALLTTESWDAIDRNRLKMNEWIVRVEKVLTQAEYNLLRSNTGIDKPENEAITESGDIGAIRNALAVDRNYMHIRILILKRVIDKL